MACFKRYALGIVFSVGLGMLAWPARAAAPVEHFGMCDGSAAIAVGPDHFLVVNDEDSWMRVYPNNGAKSAKEINARDLLAPFGLGEKKEIDFEGAARIGQRIYWIGSHSRNKKGEKKPERHLLFATDLVGSGDNISLTVAGKPYTGLLAPMENNPALKPYGLRQASTKAAEADGGLNIEGLAASPDGALLIGFRNPLHAEKALLLKLLNPDRVLAAGAGQTAPEVPRFDPPIELALDGRGIRSIEYAEVLQAYLIVAGPARDKGDFKLFRWDGLPASAPKELPNRIDADGMHPEALFALGDGHSFKILSDDGDHKFGKVTCKEIKKSRSESEKKFRSIVIQP